MISEAVFWIASALILYAHVGYAVAVALLARVRPRSVRRAPIRPTVTLLIVAHNEARNLHRKVQNCLALDYPRDKLEIVVASDGSTDGTLEVAREYTGQGVTAVGFEARRGKPSVLNDMVPRCRGEIVVLSDARQVYDPRALLTLVEDFADPSVGAVSGELHLVNDRKLGVGDGITAYWRYEKFLRRNESRFDSTVGVTGAIYAIRKHLFEPMAADTLLDDVLIPMRIIRRGYRTVFEPDARAFDRVSESSAEEFTRKVRTISGTLQLFAREQWLWSPRRNRLWFQAMSHKVLRIVGPFLLVAALLASACGMGSRALLGAAFAGQAIFYALAIGGFLMRDRTSIWRCLSAPYTVCLLNVAAVLGIVRFLVGSQAVTWQKASDLTVRRAGGLTQREPGE